jgi:hypothetical protein
MSQMLGGAEITTVLGRKDRRLVPTYQVIRRERDFIVDRDLPTSYPGGYANNFWPGGRGFTGDGSADVAIQTAVWGRSIARLAWGAGSRVGFVGITFDQNGNVLAAVTCSLFRTSTKEWIMDIVSGTDGSFLLQSWYSPDNHFIVFSKAGSPEVFGTTRQTLVGA